MYNIYIFNAVDIDSGEILLNKWTLAATYSQLLDAQQQLQRFINQGISEENLKLELQEDN